MNVITVRNVHRALPNAIDFLLREGIRRESRNGPVVQAPTPVTTVYQRPSERVVFWPERDANPFFHLFESLWMLSGRNDVASVARYAKQMMQYSDDGATLHGAYGFRWRNHFVLSNRQDNFYHDQLPVIADRLRENPNDRRQVLSMWDAEEDFGREGKDLPCNLMATFQVSPEGALDLVVFNRSNDIVWGCYGANAVHFSYLHEYMALLAGYPMGTYTQVSVNWHAYLDTLTPLSGLPNKAYGGLWSVPSVFKDPYSANEVRPLILFEQSGDRLVDVGLIGDLNGMMQFILREDQRGFPSKDDENEFLSPGMQTAYQILAAHHEYKNNEQPTRFNIAMRRLSLLDPTIDFVRAAIEWVERRRQRFEAKADEQQYLLHKEATEERQ